MLAVTFTLYIGIHIMIDQCYFSSYMDRTPQEHLSYF